MNVGEVGLRIIAVKDVEFDVGIAAALVLCEHPLVEWWCVSSASKASLARRSSSGQWRIDRRGFFSQYSSHWVYLLR
jgi:hypothetical protein